MINIGFASTTSGIVSHRSRQSWSSLKLLSGCPPDQDYFRRSREERFGRTLEEVVRDREARLPSFRASLDPLRRTVERQDFLSGKTPGYADYIVFGAFQWARAISDFELLASDDPVRAWRARMLDIHGGLARSTPAYGN
jgi:glutathione S-transferase